MKSFHIRDANHQFTEEASNSHCWYEISLSQALRADTTNRLHATNCRSGLIQRTLFVQDAAGFACVPLFSPHIRTAVSQHPHFLRERFFFVRFLPGEQSLVFRRGDTRTIVFRWVGNETSQPVLQDQFSSCQRWRIQNTRSKSPRKSYFHCL